MMLGHRILQFDSIDSTNTRAKQLARTGLEHGAVLLARTQTGGRGRSGKRWESPPGGLWMSVLLRQWESPASAGAVSLATGLAVRDTVHDSIQSSGSIEIKIKWPNDVLVHTDADEYSNRDARAGWKKIAGVLTEGITLDDGYALVVGVGLNVNTQVMDLPVPLRDSVASIHSLTGSCVDIQAVRHRLLQRLDEAIGIVIEAGGTLEPLLQQLTEHSVLIGRTVSVRNGSDTVTGIVDRIRADGALIIIDDTGKQRSLSSGEVVEFK